MKIKYFLFAFILFVCTFNFNIATAVEKAWGVITFDASGNPSIANSFNVASVTIHNGLPWTAQVTLTSGFSNANYVVCPSVRYTYGGVSPWNYYPVTTNTFWMASPGPTTLVSLGFVAFGN